MLQALRKQTASIFAKVLFGLLVLSFAVWGVGDVFTSGGAGAPVAEVGEREIPPGLLAREIQLETRRMQQQFGFQIDPEMARQMGVVDRALDRVVAQTLLDIQADEMGVLISDDLAARTIRTDPAFQGSLGRFDENVFRAVLFNSGLTEDTYVALLKEDMARRQVVGSITGLDTVPDALLRPLFEYRNERRVAETVVVRATDQDVAEPTEADLRAYYEENKDTFLAPEYRAATAIVLNPETTADLFYVPEDDVRAYYEERVDALSTPERRAVEQIVFGTKDDADAAAERLAQGAGFQSVAIETTGAGPVDLGLATRGELGLDAIADAAFALDAGATSAPVETPLGWHILRVTEVVPGSVPTFEELRGDLEAELRQRAAAAELPDLGRQLDDELGGGATLEEAASALGVAIVTVDAIDDTGLGRDGETVDGVPADENFAATIFDQDEGVDSLLVETSNGYFVVRVDRITPSAPRPFDEVREAVAGEMLQDRRQAAAKDRADALFERAEGGRSLSELAVEDGLSLATSMAVTRDDQDPDAGVTGPVTAALFTLGRGEIGLEPTRDGYTLFRVADIQTPDPAADAARRETLEAQTLESIKGDLLQQLDGAIRADHEVTIDRRAIETLL